MLLMPASRPFSHSSSVADAPINRPPMSALIGVKFSTAAISRMPFYGYSRQP